MSVRSNPLTSAVVYVYTSLPHLCSLLYTSDKQVNTAKIGDLLLVFTAFLFDIFGITIKNVHVNWIYINVAEEVIIHEGMVRLRMVTW